MGAKGPPLSGSFPPSVWFKKREIHTGFHRFLNLRLGKNLSLPALAELFRAYLKKPQYIRHSDPPELLYAQEAREGLGQPIHPDPCRNRISDAEERMEAPAVHGQTVNKYRILRKL